MAHCSDGGIPPSSDSRGRGAACSDAGMPATSISGGPCVACCVSTAGAGWWLVGTWVNVESAGDE